MIEIFTIIYVITLFAWPVFLCTLWRFFYRYDGYNISKGETFIERKNPWMEVKILEVKNGFIKHEVTNADGTKDHAVSKREFLKKYEVA